MANLEKIVEHSLKKENNRMKYPNALEGVKKIYKAEILELIAGILALVGAILLLVGIAGTQVESTGAAVGGILGGGLVMLAVAVLGIIAFIMGILGVKKAIPDEENFKTALYAMILGIVASVVIGFAKEGSALSNAGSTLSSICSFLAQYYIITAIIVLAQKLADKAMEDRGLKTRKALMIVWIAKIVLEVIQIFLNKNTAVDVTAGVLALIAAVIAIVAYVMYLKLLSKARVMLEK